MRPIGYFCERVESLLWYASLEKSDVQTHSVKGWRLPGRERLPTFGFQRRTVWIITRLAIPTDDEHR